MSRKSLLIVALPALLALMLLGAGCGGGDDESSNDAAPGAATATESSEPDASGGSLENCKEFQLAASQVGQQFAAAAGGAGNADFGKAAKAFDELTSRAPSEIKADFETINDAFQKLAEALEGVDLSATQAPDQETLAKLQEAMSGIDQVKVSEASARITAWAQKNCKA